jgi:hypothetical protein
MDNFGQINTTTALIRKTNDELVLFETKYSGRHMHVIKLCSGKPIFINWPWTQMETITYYVPCIWFANPAITVNEQSLSSLYKKIYNNQDDFTKIFMFHMNVYMNEVVEFIKTTCLRSQSTDQIKDQLNEMVIEPDNLCSVGIIIPAQHNYTKEKEYKHYYSYRIDNFLRDNCHKILCDFIIMAPYAIFGKPEDFSFGDMIDIFANYLYGKTILNTSKKDMPLECQYGINDYGFIISPQGITRTIIEDNDYNLNVEGFYDETYVKIEENKEKNEEEDMDLDFFSGGSIRKTSTMWILLIALIILLIFMYLNNVNKYSSRVAAVRNCDLSLLRSAA